MAFLQQCLQEAGGGGEILGVAAVDPRGREPLGRTMLKERGGGGETQQASPESTGAESATLLLLHGEIAYHATKALRILVALPQGDNGGLRGLWLERWAGR